MIYLASPYSHPDAFVREERYLRASKALTWLLERKRWAYSPIVHCHELAKIGGLPGDASFWREYDFYMLSKCDLFMMLRIEGWEASKGMRAEREEAQRLNIPWEYL